MARKSVFCDAAVVSGLATLDLIQRVEADLRASGGETATQINDDQLAVRLVERGVVTAYQAEQLKAGRTKFNLGPYVITDWIGQGGMGQVFKAVHEIMGRETAVKVLPLDRATPSAIDSFVREIRTQARLDHPNLVRAYDAGQDGNVHYLATEYVPGMDLRRLVRSNGPLTMRLAASIIRQSAEGLAYAHERGLVHRNVKPGNILVTPKGVAKISDLGLAGFIPDADEEDPRVGKIVGTADYLSPEQIKTPQFVDAVSDIYSLGCALYYSITGKVPFPGGTTQVKARRHCEETPWHPRRFNSQVSEEFVEIIADMMEKDPTSRIQTASEVSARLEPWASEPGPIIPQTSGEARWLPPPLPGELGDLQETADSGLNILESPEGDDSQYTGGAQAMQGTDSIASAVQETVASRNSWRLSDAPPLSLGQRMSTTSHSALIIALTIAIPTSLFVGGAIGFLLRAALE